MSTHNTIHDKGHADDHMKDKKIGDQATDKKKAPELSPDDLKKVVGGNLGAPIYRKKP
jgi:hypothetical protein